MPAGRHRDAAGRFPGRPWRSNFAMETVAPNLFVLSLFERPSGFCSACFLETSSEFNGNAQLGKKALIRCIVGRTVASAVVDLASLLYFDSER